MVQYGVCMCFMTQGLSGVIPRSPNHVGLNMAKYSPVGRQGGRARAGEEMTGPKTPTISVGVQVNMEQKAGVGLGLD